MRIKLLALFMLFSIRIFGQVPSITFIDNPQISGESNPVLYKANNGGYLYTNSITKSNPDSVFTALTSLNSSLVPQWSKIFKVRSNTVISDVVQRSDGKITLTLNGYNTQTRYYPILTTLSATGDLSETIEIVDSLNLTQTGAVFNPIVLPNNANWFFSGGSSPKGMFRLNASGQVTFAKQAIFKNQTNQLLGITTSKHIPGGNKWVGGGRIFNTNLAFYLQMEDTIVRAFHVYNVPNSASTINQIHLLPNSTDMIISIAGGVTFTHLARINENGGIVWKKSFALPNVSLSQSDVDSNGEIWLYGSTSPLASGVLAHFSATGAYLSHKCQFKLGNSLSRITGFSQVSGNEFLTMQSAFYNSSNSLVLNRINASMNFLCFDYPINDITDTTFNFVDSASTQISFQSRKFGTKTNLSFPVFTLRQNQITGNVTCMDTEVSPDLKQDKIRLVPNPALNEIQVEGIHLGTKVLILSPDGRILKSENYAGSLKTGHLPKGIYFVEIPDSQLRRRFVKE